MKDNKISYNFCLTQIFGFLTVFELHALEKWNFRKNNDLSYTTSCLLLQSCYFWMKNSLHVNPGSIIIIYIPNLIQICSAIELSKHFSFLFYFFIRLGSEDPGKGSSSKSPSSTVDGSFLAAGALLHLHHRLRQETHRWDISLGSGGMPQNIWALLSDIHICHYHNP